MICYDTKTSKKSQSNNLLILVGGIRVLPELILKFWHLKYRRSKSRSIVPINMLTTILNCPDNSDCAS